MSDTTRIENTRKVHQGDNVKFALKYLEDKEITQEELAERMGSGYYQSNLSPLLKLDVIPDDILEKIAKALDIPIVFLRDFPLKAVLQKIIKHAKSVEINGSQIVTVTGDVEQDNTDPINTSNFTKLISDLSKKVGELTIELKYARKQNK